MHEMALIQNILRTCLNAANSNHAKKIVLINLEIGDFTLVVESMLQRSFEIIQQGTLAESAQLVMIRSPGVIQCDDCHKSSEIWFNAVKSIADPARKEKLTEMQLSSSPPNYIADENFTRNLFQCKFCGSHNTILTKGKEILIKNIKVE